MSPNNVKPEGKLRLAIENRYGTYEKFFQGFKNKALSLKGSGYTFLETKQDKEIDIINVSNQDSPLLYGYIPLFNIDMWEHAYYLNYKNNKSEYLDNFYNTVLL